MAFGKKQSQEEEGTVFIVQRALAGQKVNLPDVGEVQVGLDGSVEVSEHLAEQMTQLGSGWVLKGDADEADELKARLDSMTLEQMIELAVAAEIPAEEYKKVKVNLTLMKRFLLKRLPAAE